MELFEIRKLLSITIVERNKLEKELLANRLRLKEGSLIERYVICGKEGCKCSKGEGKHGPFLYLNKKDCFQKYVQRSLFQILEKDFLQL